MAEKKQEKNNDNLRLYEQLRQVPEHALKPIQAGRLKGMSDINPIWRVKAMTEAFGPCGIGWKYEVTKQWQEQYGVEVKSFTNINLYIKVNGEWSDPIPGTGGATLVENGRNGIYVNDEGHKMSLTDALSVAMKHLGVAADVYFNKDKEKSQYDTKYDQQAYSAQRAEQDKKAPAKQPAPQQLFDDPLYEAYMDIKPEIDTAPSIQYLTKLYKDNVALQGYKPFTDALSKRKAEVA